MSEDSEEIDMQVAETPVKMIGGIRACRKVQEASGWPLDESEDWLRKGIWNLDPRSWYKPPFLGEYKVQQDNLDRTFPIIPGDEACSDMNDFDLADICMTEVSLDQAIAANFPTTTPIAEKTTSDIPFLVAAHHVVQHLGVPIDAAKAALSHAISAGAVKAWRPPDEYDPRAKARGRPTASEIFRTLLDIEKPRIELGPSRKMYKSDEGDAVVDIASMAEWMIRFGLALGRSVDGVAPRDDREHAVCQIVENAKPAPPSEKNENNDLSSSDSEHEERHRDVVDEGAKPESPRPIILFAIACYKVQKHADYSERAAEAWLSEAIRDQVEAWIYSAFSSGLDGEVWMRTKNVRDAERLYVSIEDLERALAADFPVEKPNQKPKKKRGPRPMDIGLTVVAEATRWAENEALDPGARNFGSTRLI